VNVGAWDQHYAGLTEPMPYGDDASYRLAADFVHGHGPVEDWGCGGGWLRRFVIGNGDEYVGVDGSGTPFAAVWCDLVTYRSSCGSVVLRHVLEHNHEWRAVLDNACASARERLCVVLFTPLAERTHTLMSEPLYGNVPVIAFALSDILEPIVGTGFAVTYEVLQSPATYYGVETIVRAVR